MGDIVSTENQNEQGEGKADLPEDKLRMERDTAVTELGKLRRTLADMKSKVMPEEDRQELAKLREAQAKADEDAKKKAGEWDSLRQSLVTKHTTELEAERKRVSELETRYRTEKVEAAFSGAVDLFGGHDASKTVLTADMASAYLGKYVAYEDVEVAGKAIKAVIVRDPEGNIVLDGKGNPAKFNDAIVELINQLPAKDRILRGSGKTGSGSSGGSITGSREIDFRNLTPEQRKDPKVLAALRASLPRGSVIMGEAYNP